MLTPSSRRLRVVALALALAIAVPAAAAAAANGHHGASRLTGAEALRAFESDSKVAAWLSRYPRTGLRARETYAPTRSTWTVTVFSGRAGAVAHGTVSARTGSILEAWTGPQVAWQMARGLPGTFAGTTIDDPWVWGFLCLVFLLGLADLRRPLSLRNLDLLFLLSPAASLWFFDRGDVFTAVPLFYPLLVWLVLRGAWIGVTGRRPPTPTLRPAWLLVAATVLLVYFRVGLNIERSNVIDVGYASVIGADRIVHGQAPWGHFPAGGAAAAACGPALPNGNVEGRVQANGRCESPADHGDTYGPVAYEAYVPAVRELGWSGRWDGLRAAHVTTIVFDLLTLAGLWILGRRFGGGFRLAASLVFAWAAYPFVDYASNSNTNDLIVPCFLVWGFLAVSSPSRRGVFAALSGWTKFASLVLAPLWLTYPDRRPKAGFAFGFGLATLAAFSIVLLDPSPLHELRVFWNRAIGFQLHRDSPFSLWDWRQYHARGLPDLHLLQQALQALLVIAAVVVAFVPRRKSPLQLVALSAALLAGFQLVLTYWLYTYLPWLLPFAAIALLAPAVAAPAPVAEEELQPQLQLVPAG